MVCAWRRGSHSYMSWGWWMGLLQNRKTWILATGVIYHCIVRLENLVKITMTHVEMTDTGANTLPAGDNDLVTGTKYLDPGGKDLDMDVKYLDPT